MSGQVDNRYGQRDTNGLSETITGDKTFTGLTDFSDGEVILPIATPVNAVAASGTMTVVARPASYVKNVQAYGTWTSANTPVDGQIVTIDNQVYTFMADPVGTYDVAIGDATQSAINLASKIAGNAASKVDVVRNLLILTLTFKTTAYLGALGNTKVLSTNVTGASVSGNFANGVTEVSNYRTVGTKNYIFTTTGDGTNPVADLGANFVRVDTALGASVSDVGLALRTAVDTDPLWVISGTGATCTVTALVKGAGTALAGTGNFAPFVNNCETPGDVLPLGTTTVMSGGIDGTPGLKGMEYYDATTRSKWNCLTDDYAVTQSSWSIDTNVSKIIPPADSTTAIQLTKADGTNAIISVGTDTNSYDFVGIGIEEPASGEQNSLRVVTPQVTGAVSRAGNFESHFAGTYGSTAVQAAAYLEGANTQDHVNAVQAYVYGNGASISKWAACYFAAKAISSGTVLNYYGFYNRAGGLGATNNYAFYSDALDPSLLLGKLALTDVVLTNVNIPYPMYVSKPFVAGAYGISTAQMGVFSNDVAAVGKGGAIALGGKSGLASDPYANAYLFGGRESLSNYAGYFAIYTTSGGSNGETNSANYERMRILSAGQPLFFQHNPTTETTGAVTLTLAKILTGIITGTPDDARAYTLDTGANMDASGAFAANMSFDWTIQNNSIDADDHIITLTGSSGHTIIGSPLIYPYRATNFYNCTARFRTRKTAANTFITYRLA